MSDSLPILAATAATIGLVHTLIGPDHYVPFIVLGRAEGWSLRRTLAWTAVCGLGHVLSSVVLGAAGIALGWALGALELVEGTRGTIASYTLIGFGLLYFVWGVWHARRGHRHAHVHVHEDGTLHAHPHAHPEAEEGEAAPPRAHLAAAHDEPGHLRDHRRTLWVLFVIFVLGPCEPLIPLLMVPAATHSSWGVALVAGVFGLTTVSAMLVVVALGHTGLRALRFPALERHVHALAGLTIAVSGLAVQVLGI